MLETQRPGVRLRREQREHVAEVLVGRRVRRVETDRLFEFGARLAVFAAGGIESREVVVRLGELRVVLHELLQDGLRLAWPAGVGENHRFQESHLRILRIARQNAIGALERRRRLAGVVQPRHLGQIVGRRAPRGAREHGGGEQPGGEDP